MTFGVDEIGYYEIGDAMVGDDVEQMLSGTYGPERWAMGAPMQMGMPPMRRPMPQPARISPGMANARSQAYGAALAGASSLVRQREPQKSRQYVAGFDSVTTIAAGASQTISFQPQVLFRPERLIIDANIQNAFILTDLKVGKNSQFVQSGAIPASAFGPNAFGVRLKCDTAQVSSTISLAVTNLSNGALRFLAALIGEAVE